LYQEKGLHLIIKTGIVGCLPVSEICQRFRFFAAPLSETL
jgi:hypothetical protein